MSIESVLLLTILVGTIIYIGWLIVRLDRLERKIKGEDQ